MRVGMTDMKYCVVDRSDYFDAVAALQMAGLGDMVLQLMGELWCNVWLTDEQYAYLLTNGCSVRPV